MDYSKPKVLIDLEEYEYLKSFVSTQLGIFENSVDKKSTKEDNIQKVLSIQTEFINKHKDILPTNDLITFLNRVGIRLETNGVNTYTTKDGIEVVLTKIIIKECL